MSTPVKTPSRTTLPDGRLSFIVFRRDLTTSAPDRVAVRVIAKVMRGMTFESAAGASVTKLDDQWAIRGTSYDLSSTLAKILPARNARDAEHGIVLHDLLSVLEHELHAAEVSKGCPTTFEV